MQRCVDTRLRMFTWVKSPQSCFFKFYFLTHLPQSYACEVQWFEIPSMKCSWKLSVYFIRKLKLMNKDLMDIELFYSFCFQCKREEMRETRVANRKGRNVSSSSSSEPQFLELLLFTECLRATSSHSRDTQTFILFESSKWVPCFYGTASKRIHCHLELSLGKRNSQVGETHLWMAGTRPQ